MSTFMQKKENVVRKWYILDAAGKPMGRVAVAAADLLRGKNAPEFTPNVDCGNFVIIVNAEKAVLTGKKMEDKYYYHHSGYIGGMKAVQAKTMMATKPERAMEHFLWCMLFMGLLCAAIVVKNGLIWWENRGDSAFYKNYKMN